MNYLDILVRASVSVPAAAKNVKLTNEAAQVGLTLMLTITCDISSLSQRLGKNKLLNQKWIKGYLFN